MAGALIKPLIKHAFKQGTEEVLQQGAKQTLKQGAGEVLQQGAEQVVKQAPPTPLAVNLGEALADSPKWNNTPNPMQRVYQQMADAGDGEVIQREFRGFDAGDEDSIIALQNRFSGEMINQKVKQAIPAKRSIEAAAEGRVVQPQEIDFGGNLKQNLDNFIQTEQVNLKAAPTAKMQTVEGEQTVKIFPGTKEELLAKAEQYIALREALHESGEKGYSQSRAGWESVFGHVLDEDGYPMRLSGGTRKSKEGKKLTLVSTKSTVDRKAGLRSFPGDFEGQKKARQWSERELEGHHWETAAKEADIWSAKELPNGRIGRRSQEDIDYIIEGLRNRGITGIGDKAENLVGGSKPAHMGSGLDETKPLAMHEIPKEAYDFEGIRDWAFEATDLYVRVPYGKQGKFKNKWFKNKNGIISDKGKEIGDQKAFKKKYPKSTFLAFRMEGAEGTFAVGQKTGLSLEYQRNIAREDDPDKVIEAIATYYEAGIPDKRKGASTVARRFLDKGGSDPLSEEMFFKAAQQEDEVMEDLMKLPQYQQIPEFREKINELLEIMKETQA